MKKIFICMAIIVLSCTYINGQNQDDVTNYHKIPKAPYFQRDYSGRGFYAIIEPRIDFTIRPAGFGCSQIISIGKDSCNYKSLSFIFGYRFSNYFTLGGGMTLSTEGIGFFADMRCYLLKGPITPYVGLQVGVMQFGLYVILAPRIGVEFHVSDLVGLSMFCGYQPNISYNGDMINVGLGVHFNLWPKGKPSLTGRSKKINYPSEFY